MTTSLLLKPNQKLCLRVLFVFMTVILLFLASPAESRAAGVQVILDGTPVSFDDSTGYPFLDENDRTLVPMRAVMESCGCTVDWDGVNQVATVTKGNTEVKAVAGQSFIYRNNQKVDNDSAAVVKNGRTYLPIRVVLESFGYTVKWDSLKNSVIATNDNIRSNLIDNFTIDIYTNRDIKGIILYFNKEESDFSDVKMCLHSVPYKKFLTIINDIMKSQIGDGINTIELAVYDRVDGDIIFNARTTGIMKNGYSELELDNIGIKEGYQW